MLNQFRKIAVFLLVGILVLSFTGCGQNENAGKTTDSGTAAETAGNTAAATETKKEEPVTLKVFNSYQITMPSEILDNPLMTEIKDRFGVIIDWSPFMGSGDAAEKASLLMASNELPDIFLHGDPNINKKLLDNKLIIPLDDLVQASGKDIVENCSQALKFNKMFHSDDTNTLYFIPNLVNSVNFYPNGYDCTFQYRWDLYKKMGSPKLESLDDLLNYCIEAQKLEPKNSEGKKNYGLGVPLADPGGWAYIDWNKSHYDGLADVGGNPVIMVDLEKNILVPRVGNPDNSFWKAMEFYNKAYRAGVLDPESATMKFQQCQDKGKAMRYFVGSANWLLGWPNSILQAANEPEKGFVPTILDAKADNVFFYFKSPVGVGGQYSITKDCKNAEKAMEFLNYLASWEGVEFINNGPEGGSWDMVDGKPKVKPEVFENPDPDAGKKFGTSYLAPNMLINGGRMNPKGWKTIYAQDDEANFAKGLTAAELDFSKTMGFKFPTQLYDSRPNNGADVSLAGTIVPDPSGDTAIIITKISGYMDTAVVKAIYAKTEEAFNAQKAKMLEDLKAMDYDKAFDWYNTKYEEAKVKLASMQ